MPVIRVLVAALLTTLSLPLLATVPIPNTQVLPYDRSGTPAERDVPFIAWYEDLSLQGYTETEILMSGTAFAYNYVDEAAQSPVVSKRTGSATDYTTRVLMRFPSDPADFNGVVHMEILNATARYDGSPMWNLTYPSIMDDGAAWIGVTYSDTTAAFMRDVWGTTNFPAPAGAQPRDNSRYATLNIPNRSYTWDILNQAAALVRAQNDARNPMQGYAVQAVIASGYSQSAGFTVTYANSFYPSYSELNPCTAEKAAAGTCEPIVNGYLVVAGGAFGRKLDGSNGFPAGDRRNCDNALNRVTPCWEKSDEPDVEDPFQFDLPKVMRFTTESDIDSARVRQTMANQPLLRTYEVAGSSHVDFWGSVEGNKIASYSFGTNDPVDSECDLPLNPLRTGVPLSAVQHNLWRWILLDEEPPPSAYLIWEGDFDQVNPTTFRPLVDWVRDDGDFDATDGDDGVGDGNVVGGVRPPRIQAPLGRYFGVSPFSGPTPSVAGFLCASIIGGFEAYTEEELIARYGTRETLVLSTWWNMFTFWLEGFILAVDAPQIIQDAFNVEELPE